MTAEQARHLSNVYKDVDKELLDRVNYQIKKAAESGDSTVVICMNPPLATKDQSGKMYTPLKSEENRIVTYFTQLGYAASIEKQGDAIYLLLEW